MSSERLFLDTAFALAFLNSRDQYHSQAELLFPRVFSAKEVWVTEAVLTEIGNALSRTDRQAAFNFINDCYSTIRNMVVVNISTDLFRRAANLYNSRPDKEWGLTDCISFVVMEENGLIDALTTDRHFVQAGFRALMLNVS